MITDIGKYIIPECLSSSRKITHFIISQDDFVDKTAILSDYSSYDLIEVKDSRITKDLASGKIVLMFSTYENSSSLKSKNIKTVGLVSDGDIVFVENTNKTISSGETLNQDYYIPLQLF